MTQKAKAPKPASEQSGLDDRNRQARHENPEYSGVHTGNPQLSTDRTQSEKPIRGN
jgi:hypothetical protein